jgi:putative hydrolase of the HAD superfamily
VLDKLRSRGLPLALVSDSSAEAPALWTESPLATRIAVTAFSCLVGVRKPDPALYLYAVRRLRVRPESCLYVGDGGGGELTGAVSLGMDVVRLRLSGDVPTDRYDDDASFAGPEVSSLSALLDRL